MERPEFLLQKQVCAYLRCAHRNVFFMSDTVANVRLTLPQQARNKSIQCSDFHCPDIIIFEPKKGYSGIFLELKAKSPYKANGDIYASDHLRNQSETIIQLQLKGYHANFYWDIDHIIKIIDWYLK